MPPLTNIRHTPSSSLTVLGIQQLHFNPMKPHMLYASFRRCGSIYAWDLRGGSTNGEPLYKYCFTESGSGGRKMSNQRLRFDVDIGGRWLGIGNQVRSFAARRAVPSLTLTSPLWHRTETYHSLISIMRTHWVPRPRMA